MKLVKKLLVGALSLALVVGACFTFTACGKLNNKSYAFEALTFTIVTEVEENKDGDVTVTGTKVLSLKQMFMYSIRGAKLDQLDGIVIPEEYEDAYESYKEGMLEMMLGEKILFEGKKMIFVDEMKDIMGRPYTKTTKTGTYKQEENGYVAEFVTDVTEYAMGDQKETGYLYFSINADGKLTIEMINPEVEDKNEFEVGKVYSYNFVYGEIQD